MVCNTTQSALYKVVSDYNNELDKRQNYAQKTTENMPSKTNKNHIKNSSENNNKNYRKNYRQVRNNNCHKNYRIINTHNNFNISNLFSDSDFVLICTLIFILSKNNADKKIILALVFVLIS